MQARAALFACALLVFFSSPFGGGIGADGGGLSSFEAATGDWLEVPAAYRVALVQSSLPALPEQVSLSPDLPAGPDGEAGPPATLVRLSAVIFEGPAVAEAEVREAAATTPAEAPARAPQPTGNLVRYRVRPGDTLFALARTYGTTVDAIVAANNLASAHFLREGQELLLPRGRMTAAARAPAGAASRPAALRPDLQWPTRGVLTSRFGMRWRRHHDGIDLAAPHGTPVYAAMPGTVVFAGWYYGYGRTVIVDHGNGVRTLYAHAERILVEVGQWVNRGQMIARVGCTGRCTGPHLHFEVHIHGRPTDPLRFLQ